MKMGVGFLIAAAIFVSGAAHANTVSILSGSTTIGSLTDGGGTSPITFVGYTAPLTTDNTTPFTAVTATFNPSNLLSNANTYYGTSFTIDNRTTGNGGSMNFDISSMYFSLTFGMQRTAFFQNLSGGLLHLSYTTVPGQGAGLSHFDTFGPAAVPGPIVGAGLPGIVVALGALVMLARRRRNLSSAA